MNKRPLQIAMAVLGAVPVLTGILTMLGLGDPIYASAGIPANALLDSNLRFFGGLWLVLGMSVFWLIPRIEKETTLFRALWLMIFVGGIGRLISMLFLGLPPLPFIGFRRSKSLARQSSSCGRRTWLNHAHPPQSRGLAPASRGKSLISNGQPAASATA